MALSSSSYTTREEWEEYCALLERAMKIKVPYRKRYFGGGVEMELTPPYSKGLIQLSRTNDDDLDTRMISQDTDQENVSVYLHDEVNGNIKSIEQMDLVNNYYKKLKSYYDKTTSKPGFNPRNFDYSYQSICEVIEKQKRRKRNKLVSINTIEDPNIPNYLLQLGFKNRKPIQHERVGLYRIDFDEDDVVFYIKWEVGAGRARLVDSCAYGTEGGFLKLEEAHALREAKQRQPKRGIYIATLNLRGIVEYKKHKPAVYPVIHEVKEKVYDSINLHFKNLEKRKYHGRTIVLYGEQGTGKSQMLGEIALRYGKTHSVIFTDDLSCMIQHENLAAQAKVPTLVFLEEAEEAIAKYNPGQGFDRVNTSVKNVMSGFHAVKNKAGTYKIYTTNHPERLDDTILNRRERVDEMFHVGPLNEIDAGRVASIYLGKSMPQGNIGELFTNMSGCDIKYICQDAVEQSEANGQIDDDGNAIVSYQMLQNGVKARCDDYYHASNFKRLGEGPLQI